MGPPTHTYLRTGHPEVPPPPNFPPFSAYLIPWAMGMGRAASRSSFSAEHRPPLLPFPAYRAPWARVVPRPAAR